MVLKTQKRPLGGRLAVVATVLVPILFFGCFVEPKVYEFDNPLDAESSSHVYPVVPGFNMGGNPEGGGPYPDITTTVTLGSVIRFEAKSEGGAKADLYRWNFATMRRPSTSEGQREKISKAMVEVEDATTNITLDESILGKEFYFEVANPNGPSGGNYELDVRFAVRLGDQWYEADNQRLVFNVRHPLRPFVDETGGGNDVFKPRGMTDIDGAARVDSGKATDLQITNWEELPNNLQLARDEIGNLKSRIDSVAWDLNRDGTIDTTTPKEGIVSHLFPSSLSTDYVELVVYLDVGHVLRYVLPVVNQQNAPGGRPDYGNMAVNVYRVGRPYVLLAANTVCQRMHGDPPELQVGSKIQIATDTTLIPDSMQVRWRISPPNSEAYYETNSGEPVLLELKKSGRYHVVFQLLAKDSTGEDVFIDVLTGSDDELQVDCGEYNFHDDAGGLQRFAEIKDDIVVEGWPWDSATDTLRLPGSRDIGNAFCNEPIDSLFEITAYILDLDMDGVPDDTSSDSIYVARRKAPIENIWEIGIWYEINGGPDLVYDKHRRNYREPSIKDTRVPGIEEQGFENGEVNFRLQKGSEVTIVFVGENLALLDSLYWHFQKRKQPDSTFDSVRAFSDTIRFRPDSVWNYRVFPLGYSKTREQPYSGNQGQGYQDATIDIRKKLPMEAISDELFWVMDNTSHETTSYDSRGHTITIDSSLFGSNRYLSGTGLHITAYEWDTNNDYKRQDDEPVGKSLVIDSLKNVPGVDTIGVWYVIENGLHRIYDRVYVRTDVREPYFDKELIVDLDDSRSFRDMQFRDDTLSVLYRVGGGVVWDTIGSNYFNVADYFVIHHYLVPATGPAHLFALRMVVRTDSGDAGWFADSGRVILQLRGNETHLAKFDTSTGKRVPGWGGHDSVYDHSGLGVRGVGVSGRGSMAVWDTDDVFYIRNDGEHEMNRHDSKYSGGFHNRLWDGSEGDSLRIRVVEDAAAQPVDNFAVGGISKTHGVFLTRNHGYAFGQYNGSNMRVIKFDHDGNVVAETSDFGNSGLTGLSANESGDIAVCTSDGIYIYRKK